MPMPRSIRCLTLGLTLAAALSAAGPWTVFAADAPAVPCDQVEAKLRQTEPPRRLPIAETAIKMACQPLPPAILTAIRTGSWPDGGTIAPLGRVTLLIRATEARYAEAETLSVSILENGSWPDGSQIAFEDGANLIRGLKPALTRFRVRLLLDVYEQIRVPAVRQAVLQTLHGAPFEEALLPALDAVYDETGPVQVSGLTAIGEQPEKVAADVHARLLRTLPEGPLLSWAERLANAHPSPAVVAAKKERGLR